jgi:FkbM family methyltransferase
MKTIVRDLLCSNITGGLILRVYPNRIPDIRWRPYKFVVQRKGVSKKIAAMLFWGFYESAEIRFIHQYFKGDTDVVELGGSMGIVSSHLASLQQNGKKLVIVEANPALIDTLEENVNSYRKPGSFVKVYNKAVSYTGQEIALKITEDSTESAISNQTNEGQFVKVSTIKLSDLVMENQLENFTMVCDIEGAEAEIINEDFDSLRKCKNLFIELHETNYQDKIYSINDLVTLIIDKHRFVHVDQYGPVFYFSRVGLNDKSAFKVHEDKASAPKDSRT